MKVLRLSAVMAAVTVAIGGAAAIPAAAWAQPADVTLTQTETSSCAVADATLRWGIKESFRSYISGGIANGDWEVSDGATYETPEFGWSGGTGEWDPASATGFISYTGTVRFTGHDGVLDMTVANPTIHISNGTATLHADMRSNDTGGNVAIDEAQAELGAIDGEIAGGQQDGDEVALTDAPTVLTASGAPAFGDFYIEGDALDPLSFVAPVSCAATEPGAVDEPADADTGASAEATDAASDTDASAADTNLNPWLIGAIVAVVGALGVFAAVSLVRRRNERANTATAESDPGNPAAGL